jgi:hypothetical protein
MFFVFDTGDVRGYHADDEKGRAHIKYQTQGAILERAEFSVLHYRADDDPDAYRVIAAGWAKANGEYTYSCDEWLK